MTIRQKFATFVLAASVLGGGFVAIDAGTRRRRTAPGIAVAATIDSRGDQRRSGAGHDGNRRSSRFASRMRRTPWRPSLEVDAARIHQAWIAR